MTRRASGAFGVLQPNARIPLTSPASSPCDPPSPARPARAQVLGYAHKMLHAPSVDEGAGQRSRHLAREREAARAKAEIAARKAAALRKV